MHLFRLQFNRKKYACVTILRNPTFSHIKVIHIPIYYQLFIYHFRTTMLIKKSNISQKLLLMGIFFINVGGWH